MGNNLILKKGFRFSLSPFKITLDKILQKAYNKRMKNLILWIASVLLLAVGLAGCSHTTYTINYNANHGGSVVGETSQTVENGGKGTEVTAVPDDGYVFLSWSDGVKTSTRREVKVKDNITLYASFIIDENVYYTIMYQAGEGGRVIGKTEQTLKVNTTTESVTAEPYEGYEFAGWSDGVKETTREVFVTENRVLTAIFKRCEYIVTYEAGWHGSIVGETVQNLYYGEETTAVTAMPDEGYIFTKWSDGVTTAERKDLNVRSSITIKAEFEILVFPVHYRADEGGYIKGDAEQSIRYGYGSQTVTAVPYENYEFIGWSDGFTRDWRHDENIKTELEVTAHFKIKKYDVLYKANSGGSLKGNTSQVINYKESSSEVTAIPDAGYEFLSWSDGITTPSRKDEKIQNNMELRAAFAPIGQITYKVLLVYIDEIKATLKTIKGETISVNYKMSAMERKVCELLTRKIEACLNDMFEGKVKFIVDEYYTTQPIGSEQMDRGNQDGFYTYGVWANEIQEVEGIVDHYRSVLTVFGMNDFSDKLHCVAGSAHRKYGYIHLETYISIYKNSFLGRMLDLTVPTVQNHWNTCISIIAHEFTHTAEGIIAGQNGMKYHAVIQYYSYQGLWDLAVTKLYLTQQAIVDGKKVGIPPSYWQGII